MSVTRDVISAISKGPCAALLSPAGFMLSSPHFWRDEKGINHAINFQASQWGTRESGSFTINLGVSSRALYEGFTGRRFPTNRGTALWPISVRIGGLTPDRKDRSWKVDSGAEANVIGEEVVESLRQYALPFFAGLRTPEQLIDRVQTPMLRFRVFPAQVPLILAIVAVESGDVPKARSLLQGAFADSQGKPFEPTVRRVAATLGVSLDDA